MKIFGSSFGSSRDADARRPDLCVVGGGAAGYAAALTGAALGATTLLIDSGFLNGSGAPGGARVGFDAPFAVWREAARRAAESGAAADWAAIAARAGAVAKRAALACSAERLAAAGVTVMSGHARFIGPDRLVVAGAGTVAARRFVIATGRVAVAPGAPGLDLLHALDPHAALALSRRPDRVAILGAGTTGLALAQTFARLGAPTVAIDREAALGELPREFAEPILRRLAAEGVRLLERAEIVAIDPIGGGPGAVVRLAGGEAIETSHVVLAAGWRAAVEGLGLETTGVAAGPHGVETRPDLRTAARRIYAAGAVAAGAAPDAEMAARMGRLAARGALLGLKGDARLAAAPEIWPLDPAVARLGLDEAAARAAGIEGVRVLRASFGEDDGARAAGRRDGHLALTLDGRGRLLGATLVGRDVGAAAAVLSMALAQRLDAAALADAPLPGLGGLAGLGRALGVELARRARAPAVARLMRWRRRWP